MVVAVKGDAIFHCNLVTNLVVYLKFNNLQFRGRKLIIILFYKKSIFWQDIFFATTTTVSSFVF